MKFIDTAKVAIHSILNNKSRNILTVIIVAIVSALVMFIVSLGISFNYNQTEASKKSFDENGVNYNIYGQILEQNQYISNEEIEKFNSILPNYKSIIDTVSYNAQFRGNCSIYLENQNSKNPISFDTRNIKVIDAENYYVNYKDFIINGSIWTKNDKNKNNIWLSDNYIMTLAENGFDLSVGDTLKINYTPYDKYQNTTDKIISLTIKGIFKEQNNGYRNHNMIIDINTFLNCFSEEVDGITMTYNPPKGCDYNFNEIYKQIKSFNEELLKIFPKQNVNGAERSRVYVDFIQQMKNSDFIGLIVVSLLIVLAFIVLILSIGSVANTIFISVDKNRKFIGLLKALGLNEKGVKQIIKVEAFIVIFVGLLFGGVILACTSGVVVKIVQMIINEMFAYQGIHHVVVSKFPFYLPFITFVFFYLFALIFSRGSLRKISSQDVIETISEVA